MKIKKLREILSGLDESHDDLSIYVDADGHNYASVDWAGIAYFNHDHDCCLSQDDIEESDEDMFPDKVFLISGS